MTVTPNYNFKLIDFDSIPWHEDEHDNWRIVDAVFSNFIVVTNLKGVWQNALAVSVAEKYVDPDLGTIWEVVTAHTTPSTGTFAADRTASASRWSAFTVQVTSRGAYAQSTVYSPNDFVVDGGRYGVCQAAFTSDSAAATTALSYDADVTAGNISTLLDVSAVIAATHDTNTVATGGTPTAVYDASTTKFNFGLVTGATGATGSDGSWGGSESVVVAALADHIGVFDATDSNAAKRATIQTVLDGLGLVTAHSTFPAIDDKIIMADISATPDVAESVTLQLLFDGLTALTALSATPAIGDKFAVVDISDTPDATKTVTMQELLDGADGLTDATITASDKIIHIDAGDSAAKTDTVQGILDLAGGGATAGYQFEDSDDITLQAPNNHDVLESAQTIVIPTKGLIGLGITGRVLGDSSMVGGERILLPGIRISSTNYWLKYDDSGSTVYVGQLYQALGTSQYGISFGLGGFDTVNNAAGQLVYMDIEALSIPTGSQSVEFIVGIGAAGTILQGATVTTRAYLATVDCS